MRKLPPAALDLFRIVTAASSFIIYRNAQMANVRRQNPGIGNNDVCTYFSGINHFQQLIIT